MRTPMKASCWIQDQALPNRPQHPSAGHLTQTPSETKPQTQSSADRLPQAPHHIPPHTALPVRGRKTHPLPPEHRHRSFPTQSLKKHWASLAHHGQKPKGRRSTTLKLGKGDLKPSKSEKSEKTEKYCTNEETRLKTHKTK